MLIGNNILSAKYIIIDITSYKVIIRSYKIEVPIKA